MKDFLVQAQYWHDPLHFETYVERKGSANEQRKRGNGEKEIGNAHNLSMSLSLDEWLTKKPRESTKQAEVSSEREVDRLWKKYVRPLSCLFLSVCHS